MEGVDVNEVDGVGLMLIMCVVYEGWCEGVDALVEFGVKVNVSNNVGDIVY